MAAHGEWVGNYGYIAFSTETTAGTPVAIPSAFALITDETLTTMPNHENEVPIAGLANNTYQVLKGLRTHKGDFTMVAEPNTCLQAFDSLLTRGAMLTQYTFTVTSANATIGTTYTNNGQTFTVASTIAAQTTLVAYGTGAPLASGTLTKSGSGAGDATITFSAMVAGTTFFWPFTLNTTTLPKSKTVDISTGNVVKRFAGMQASKIAMQQTGNQIMLKVSVSALSSFQGGVVASVSGSGPSTVTFDTTYDSNPGSLLLVGDVMRSYHPATGATIDFTLTGVSATTATTGSNLSSLTAGDIIFLRPQANPSFSLQSPFLWGGTQFLFGTTAVAALTGSQTRLEQGSTWEVDYNFENDNGSQRSGDFDPASLIRTLAKSSFHYKKFFDTPDDIISMNQMSKIGAVTRHFSGGASISPTANYELRITQNHLVTNDPLPKIKSNAVNYSEMDYYTQYDTTDSQEFSVGVISSLNSIT